MLLKLIAIAAALLVPGIAQAQDWRLATMGTETQSVFFIDAESIHPAQPISQGRAFVLAPGDPQILAMDVVFEFECATGRRRVVSMVVYDPSHTLITRANGSGTWNETGKGSQFDGLREIICGVRPLTPKSYGAELPFAAAEAIVAKL